MIKSTGHPEKVKSAVIIYAVIILAGIAVLTVGHFFRIAIFFYGGLFVTLAGVLLEILYMVNTRPG